MESTTSRDCRSSIDARSRRHDGRCIVTLTTVTRRNPLRPTRISRGRAAQNTQRDAAWKARQIGEETAGGLTGKIWYRRFQMHRIFLRDDLFTGRGAVLVGRAAGSVRESSTAARPNFSPIPEISRSASLSAVVGPGPFRSVTHQLSNAAEIGGMAVSSIVRHRRRCSGKAPPRRWSVNYHRIGSNFDESVTSKPDFARRMTSAMAANLRTPVRRIGHEYDEGDNAPRSGAAIDRVE